jgi:hypothetical protein
LKQIEFELFEVKKNIFLWRFISNFLNKSSTQLRQLLPNIKIVITQTVIQLVPTIVSHLFRMVLDFQVVINVDVQEVATFCGHQGPDDILQKLRRFWSWVAET